MRITSYYSSCDSRCDGTKAAPDYVAARSYYCESVREWLTKHGRTGLFGLVLVLLGACSEPDSRQTPQSSEPLGKSAEPSHESALEDTGVSTEAALKVLVFGDSISAAYGIRRDDGWVTLLETRLRQPYPSAQVINASVSGETTQGGRARLQAALDRHAPDLVILELGGNDALRGYPVDRLRDNLGAMTQMSQAQGARVVLMGMQIPPNYGPHYTREFAAAFKQVADAHNAYLVPFFLEGVALVEGMIQNDGIHPTTQAQPLLMETGWQALVATLSEQFPLLGSSPE